MPTLFQSDYYALYGKGVFKGNKWNMYLFAIHIGGQTA